MTRMSKRIHLPMKDLVQEWRSLCEIKKDVHIANSGDEGDGKSHKTAANIKYDLGGNLWDNIVYSKNPKEFYDKYDNMEQGGCMGFDEALDILDRMDWRNLNDMVKKFRGEVRKEKNGIFIYNVQLFRDLHSYWRNHRIRYWIELMPRQWFGDKNLAFVMRRQRVPFITGKRDTWMLDSQEKIWMEAMKRGAIEGEDYIRKLRMHPFYLGEHKFRALTDRDEMIYLKRRAEAKEMYEKDMDKKEPTMGRRAIKKEKQLMGLIEVLINKEGKTQKEVAQLLRISEPALSDRLTSYREGLSNSVKS